MDMRMIERFRRVGGTLKTAFSSRYEEDARYKIKGEVFITLKDAATGDVQDARRYNLVVLDASILIARLMKDNAEPPNGAFCLAVGTGAAGWNLQSPPAPTNTQRALWSELSRKTFATTNFVDANGVPAAYPTHVVDFTTTFSESEAVGPLVEMGLIGGNVSSNLSIRNPVTPPNGTYDPTVDLTDFETLINYLTFPVVNKPATSTMTIVWRLTF
jgi:hypothetical protein